MQADHRPLATTDLPADLASAVQQVTERQRSPETLEDAITVVESLLAGEGFEITADQMYQPTETRHAIQFGDRTEHVPCVLDALIAGLLDESSPVVIQSRPPTEGETVQLTVAESGISAEPSTAVFSWGMAAEDVQTPDPESVLNDEDTVSPASCSYINAFPDEAAYRRWERQVSDGVVMQLDLAAMVALAERAANGWVVAE